MTDVAVVVALLDETGSMASIAEPTINGFNTFFDGLKGGDVPTYATLIKFDQFGEEPFTRLVFDNVPLEEVIPLTAKTYLPRGGTPLNDALVQAIAVTDRAAKARKATKITLVVQTDGEENASREYPGWEGTQRVRTLVEERQAEGWQILFLGADLPTTYVAAQQRGFTRGQTMSYAASTGNTAFAASAANTRRYNTGVTGQSTFTPDQKRSAGDELE